MKMWYYIDFEGWFQIEADSDIEATDKAYDKLYDALLNIENKRERYVKITKVEEDEEDD